MNYVLFKNVLYEFHIIHNIWMSNSDAFIHHACSIICQPEDLLKRHMTQRKTFYKTPGEPPKRHLAVESNISSRRDIGRSRFYTQSFLPCCIGLSHLDCGPTLSTEEVQEGQRRKGESDAFFLGIRYVWVWSAWNQLDDVEMERLRRSIEVWSATYSWRPFGPA